jgi:hypothetical protein
VHIVGPITLKYLIHVVPLHELLQFMLDKILYVTLYFELVMLGYINIALSKVQIRFGYRE